MPNAAPSRVPGAGGWEMGGDPSPAPGGLPLVASYEKSAPRVCRPAAMGGDVRAEKQREQGGNYGKSCTIYFIRRFL